MNAEGAEILNACNRGQEGEDFIDCPICGFFERVSTLSDTFAILDALLTESRRIANADAGTVYLVVKGKLIFSAAQNDTLFPASKASKYAYLNESLALDSDSLAGYIAESGKNVNIADAYAIPAESVYKFNDRLDKKTGYRTRSILALPLKNLQGRIIGVLQVFNNRDTDEGAFSSKKEILLERMAKMVTIPLEKSFLIISMIMRMLRTSALRDPNETAGHVQRVGSLAAELYQRWAEARNIDPDEILLKKGRLRLAAMLHDIGKVGIPDAILKKPGQLNERERAIMNTHPALGASLFDADGNEIDAMAREISLHHHARWDGSGYTGSDKIPSPKGEDIPIWARIVSIADVYDALVSKRCYKEAWSPEEALEVLRKESGKSFDPELVDLFINMQDLVQAIYERYDECKEEKLALA